jgi:hypothetical protein
MWQSMYSIFGVALTASSWVGTMLYMKEKSLWERIAFPAREKLTLTVVIIVFLMALLLPAALTNFFGAAMVAIGGLVAAWSKVEPSYIYARQQEMRSDDFDGNLEKPTEDQKTVAELKLVRREHRGLALIAVGGALVAASALRSLQP